jgi:ribosomal protein S18 acetylase RimI-like enzyme
VRKQPGGPQDKAVDLWVSCGFGRAVNTQGGRAVTGRRSEEAHAAPRYPKVRVAEIPSAMMVIRRYRPGDSARVVALWEACGLTRPWNDSAADIAFCEQSPAAALLVGCEEATGELVGSVMVGHDGHRGWVYYVAVAPSRQGRGLGSQLMEAAEAWLKARGAPKLQLMVRSSNTQAIGFYQRLGYQTETVTTLSKWLRKPPVEPTGR